MRPVGAGTALSPLAAGQEVMLSLAGLSGILSVDPAAQTVTVLAGTPLGELAAQLESRGLTLAGLGGHAGQTVGGALSSGAHGSSLSVPRLAATATELRLVDGAGQPQTLTPEHPHFAAAALSLGALGVLTSVTLRTLPAQHLQVETRPLAWHEALALAPEYAQGAPYATLTWRPQQSDDLAFLLRRAWPTAAQQPLSTGPGLMDGAQQALTGDTAFSPLPRPCVRRCSGPKRRLPS
ncbi:FAD-binding protein [Deinococcus lacus]|uniref:FAD-binding protein n=1 Tax=Deinococcus lacus TaxID=392561 RepID=A0ABW1YAD5_9DEIO